MEPIQQNSAVKFAIQQIAVRTERQNPNTVLDSFYNCNIIEHLKNVNHQIIQGRRGTGKTHILHVLKNELESDHVHCIYFDCKATGSAGEIANEQIPIEHRSVQLMRDFLFNLCDEFLNYFRDTLYTHPDGKNIEFLLNHLYKECFSYEDTANVYEATRNYEMKSSFTDEGSGELSLPLNVSLKHSSKEEKEHGTGIARKVSGTTQRKIAFPNIFKCVSKLSEVTKTDFVLLIDEWSNIPLSVQPHFADFLQRCFMSSSHFTVKIAAVGARTNYFTKENGIPHGMEIGADISVAMDLDRLYMFDRNPKKTVADLYRILWKHLTAQKALNNGINVSGMIRMLFTDLDTAILLVRASEGNPRDFISILNHCIIEMDRIGEPDSFISVPIVFQAANSWYNLDKHKALDSKQKELLSEISTFVVQKKENRGFVIEESYLSSPSISSLIDARVLHVLQTERKFPLLGAGPMAIVVLDFGTYSQELLIKKSIHFLINDFCESQIFGKVNQYPVSERQRLDWERQFRVCFLDPKRTCPSFSG